MARKKLGRPAKTGPKKEFKLNDEVIAKLEEAFLIDATIAEACFLANINPSTYHLWCKKYPKLKERLESFTNQPRILAKKSVIAALPGDPELAMKYLEKRAPEFKDPKKDQPSVNQTFFITKDPNDTIQQYAPDKVDKDTEAGDSMELFDGQPND